ncbi:MAG: PIG-L family deacetylase [Candidatus Hydrogenedentes bacterium]|nr:PIG-L family deacetylase [Candidatus Hydrogenedentota bacterium]
MFFRPSITFLAALLLWSSLLPTADALSKDVLVAIFAHPDDETTVAPLLAHYGNQGAEVYVICVTSGQQGTAFTSIPAGPLLGAAREAELTTACASYGIHPPRLLQEQDGQLASYTPAQITTIKQNVRTFLISVGATVLVTFGPEGFTGHTDHITVGNLVTELVDAWYAEPNPVLAPQKLYYSMFPQSLYPSLPVSLQFFVPVPDAEATTFFDAISGVAQAQAGVDAYVTQFPPSVMTDIKNFMGNIQQGQIPLRLVRTKNGMLYANEASVFDNVVGVSVGGAAAAATFLLLVSAGCRRAKNKGDATS